MSSPAALGATAPSRARPALRAVALPTEHGGWALTLEPCLLGLAIAPSLAGVCLAIAAMVAFAARTPVKVALVDRRRHRHLPRTALATRVALLELLALLALVGAAATLAESPFWAPVLVAAPLVAVQLWFDVRSRSRRLVPELAGAVGVCAAASMIVLADGGSTRLAAAVWVVLAARVLTSIPHVRTQIDQLHRRSSSPAVGVAADVAAIVTAGADVAIDERVLAGAAAVAAVVVLQRLSAHRPARRAVVVGLRQLVLGLGVVVATALGVNAG
jgi:hypothetical protein